MNLFTGKIEEVLNNGGFVMPPLLLCVCIAWWLIGKRWAIVQIPKRSNIEIRKSPQNIDGILGQIATKIKQFQNQKERAVKQMKLRESSIMQKEKEILIKS